MPHSISAKKRVRQTERRRVRNKAKRSEIRTYIKKVRSAAEAGDIAGAKKFYELVSSKLDKSAKCNLYHANTINRQKSRLAKLIAKAEQQGS